MQNHSHPKQIPTQNCFYLVIHFLSSTTNVILHPLNTHFSRLIPRPVYTLFSQQRSDSFEKLFKHLELVSHQDIQTLENNNKNPHVFIHCFLVFGYPGETLALVVQILHEISWHRCFTCSSSLLAYSERGNEDSISKIPLKCYDLCPWFAYNYAHARASAE